MTRTEIPARAPERGPRRFPTTGAALAIASAMLACACGHPATLEECEEIFTRSAEIELASQNVTDPAVVSQRVAEARAMRGQDLMDRCVGKRITTSALECVRRAKTAAELDSCLD